jgi:NAD(P)-dependent dehydrogenase (short-subunit alcohol dehydrogenase family)
LIASETDQVVFDAAERDQCQNIVAKTVAKFGQLDVLCNIAGFAMSKHFMDITAEQWSKMVDVNLNSVFHVSQAAMPHLLESKGNIVNMASSAGLGGQAYNAPYCATKGGVVLLSKALAVEFAGRGVRVNAVCPGGVETPLTAKFEAPEDADMSLMAKLFPLMDMAQPEEIAGAVAYLASPEARFVTGDAFAIDGGQVAS